MKIVGGMGERSGVQQCGRAADDKGNTFKRFNFSCRPHKIVRTAKRAENKVLRTIKPVLYKKIVLLSASRFGCVNLAGNIVCKRSRRRPHGLSVIVVSCAVFVRSYGDDAAAVSLQSKKYCIKS